MPEFWRDLQALPDLTLTGLRVLGIAIGAWVVSRIARAASRGIEREMSRGTGLDVIERTKRAQTLARAIQNTLSAIVFTMAGLMILGEFDVNITPVLTGAGVLGVALGFGAQTLVRDYIAGFFLILEDQVRVGDVVMINGTEGLVEAINLRTIVLRDEEGAVHVFHNGEVKGLANKSKDYSYYVIAIGVPYGQDPDKAAKALRDVGETLMREPAFATHILEPIEVIGVDAFGDGQMTLKARIKTVPLKQWEIGRELRRRIAHEFPARGIDLSLAKKPAQTP